MFGFRAMKEIKKKLKRRRRPVWTLGMLAAVFLAASAAGIGGAVTVQKAVFHMTEAEPAAVPDSGAALQADPAPSQASSSRQAALRALAEWHGDVDMILRRIYWCGEETRMLGRRPAEEAAELLKSRREWEAVFDPAGRVVLEEPVEDLSPACRRTAYIGMDDSGNLSLFNGPPRKDNVVRTFFQLDVRSLETSLSKERLRELASGIRVTDKDEYNSVLSSFSDYAFRKSEGVIRPER